MVQRTPSPTHLVARKSKRTLREQRVLMGLVDLYIRTGKPIGSSTLKEAGFPNLSPATIRNYFAKLEEDGYLKQLHVSGGRIPTDRAFQLYAEEAYLSGIVSEEEEEALNSLRLSETREVIALLRRSADLLGELSHCALFLSAPRFDSDFIADIKLSILDESRCVCIVVTDFGLVSTRVLYIDKKLTSFSAKRLEAFFHWRLTGKDKPEHLDPFEEALAQHMYEEVMLHHIATYSHLSSSDLYATGLSRLLAHPEFNQPATIRQALNITENQGQVHNLLTHCLASDKLCYWIGSQLTHYCPTAEECSMIAIPYRIHSTPVGAIALLGPTRMPYRSLFGLVQLWSEYVSDALTRSVYKFKLNYYAPKPTPPLLPLNERQITDQTQSLLLMHQNNPPKRRL